MATFKSPDPKKEKESDLKRFFNRDTQGKFSVGNPGGPGRPPGSLNTCTQIRRDILSIWEEEGGKEKFRAFFKIPYNFEKALAIILAVSPKLKIEVKEDSAGVRTLTIQEKDDNS